ncbi:MAG: hypothetical protein IPK28_19615 [Devosia sp.]|nr:hypothetical protein [Devosia sp.]
MRMPLFLLALSCLPAHAGETPWQEVAPDVRVRMISSDVLRPGGTTMIGLEIDMPPGTKTYWRVPGETGIPTTIDLAGSTGITGHESLWPFPQIDTAEGFVDFVYFGPTVLPVELHLPGDAAMLEAAVTMGVCSDICVPVSAHFSLPLSFARPDRGQSLRIAQAVALTPMDWTDPRQPVGWVGYDAAADALAVRLGDDRIDPLSLIADAGPDGQLFGAPQKSPDGSLVLLPLLGGAAEGDVAGRPVQLTFMTEMGPFSLSRIIASAGSTAAGD